MKKTLTLGLALLSTTAGTQTRLRHFVFDDMFEEMQHMHEQLYRMQQQLWSHAPTSQHAPEIEEFKQARKNLLAIEPEVTQDDTNVIITFAIPNVDKKSISLTIEDNVLQGTIPAQQGHVDFSVSNYSFSIARRIEIKKDIPVTTPEIKQAQETTKSAQPVTETPAPTQSNKPRQVTYFSDLVTAYRTLPQTIDVQSIKAETKENQLILSFAKTKQAKITIAHA